MPARNADPAPMSQLVQPQRLIWDLLTPADHPRLRATLAPAAADPASFARRFYARLFEMNPGLRTLFPADLSLQEMKLAQTLVVVINGLEHSDALLPTLQKLGQQHRGYGAKPAHYVAVGDALLETLAEANGPSFDDEARRSWERLYAWVAHEMTRSAAG